ncbi:MAG: M23 family metallopeptidase [Chloroflexota bacterium]
MRRQFIFLLLGLSLLVIPVLAQDDAPETTPEATPELDELTPTYSVEGDGVVLDVYFGSLQQGRVGLLGLVGDDIASATANLGVRNFDFYALPERDGWWTLVSLSMEQTIRQYDLTVTVEQEDADEPQVLLTRFNVTSGGFIQQSVNLVPDDTLAQLLDPEVEAAELALIFQRASDSDTEAQWSENGFGAPLQAELTSPFGAVRVFNETLNTVHTGWDFNSPTGAPLQSSEAGTVAFSGLLPIRGNYVLVNHGRGVYSGYAHMSVIYVTEGQKVSAGQVLGLVGSTGRSSSAHAHFEMIVAGEWVDPVDFLLMPLP